jgi:predicted Rossmann-fold nucleotide-binding protein
MANIDSFWDPLCALLDHMRDMQFIRAGLTVSPLVVGTIEEILPALEAATRHVSESEKEMKTVEPERL